jgi:hypothetical protein
MPAASRRELWNSPYEATHKCRGLRAEREISQSCHSTPHDGIPGRDIVGSGEIAAEYSIKSPGSRGRPPHRSYDRESSIILGRTFR